MAKVNGPLFSLDASGQLAKALVYSKWKGRPYVREYVTPSNPHSIAQTFQRGIMAALVAWWHAQSTAIKGTWQTIADANTYSTFNAYTHTNLMAESANALLYGAADHTGAAVTGIPGAITATPGLNILTINVAHGTTPVLTDLMLITADPANGATSWSEQQVLASQANSVNAGATTVNLTNISAGTYSLHARFIGQNGSLSTMTHLQNVTVTGVVL